MVVVVVVVLLVLLVFVGCSSESDFYCCCGCDCYWNVCALLLNGTCLVNSRFFVFLIVKMQLFLG